MLDAKWGIFGKYRDRPQGPVERVKHSVPILLALAVLIQPPAPAQTSSDPPASPAAQLVDKVFAAMDTKASPGCAVAAIKNGRILYARGYGMADLAHDIPIARGTVFNIGSESKQFTAASIVLLAQEGKLSLDDQVRKYLPELPDFGVPITIRQVVHHTSGLRDGFRLLELGGREYTEPASDADILAVMSRQKDLNFTPGSRFLYNTSGYVLLAEIVKRVSGQSLSEFTTARIFQPLGMKSTHFRDQPTEVVKNIAYGYRPFKNGFRLGGIYKGVGPTNLMTTVEDLALWDENFYHPRVGGLSMIEQMLERGKLSSGEPLGMAFGLFVDSYRGLTTVGFSGSDGGYRSNILRFPDRHFTAVCLCNLAAANPVALTQKLAEVYLDRDMAPRVKPEDTLPGGDAATVQLSEAQLRNKVGIYLHPDGIYTRRATLQNGKLRIDTVGETRAIGENHFRGVNAPADFQFEASRPGGPLRLIETRPGNPKPAVMVFEAAAEFTPSPGELTDCAGSYRSGELDAVYEMKIQENKLVLYRLKYEPDTLRPHTRDLFAGNIGKIRFQRDAKGRVVGFTVTTGTVLNLRFHKKDR
ncbi:MAG TPA: serine hydrolase domain-containing protein [Bryobacteraceae bacterium]|jgi:CubicO group peptidase (beta-lactamase class C family)|nr:serine hydrolase domain-containing protein [Bryobacteraceae bacterium]